MPTVVPMAEEPFASGLDWLKKTMGAGKMPSGQPNLPELLMSMLMPGSAKESAAVGVMPAYSLRTSPTGAELDALMKRGKGLHVDWFGSIGGVDFFRGMKELLRRAKEGGYDVINYMPLSKNEFGGRSMEQIAAAAKKAVENPKPGGYASKYSISVKDLEELLGSREKRKQVLSLVEKPAAKREPIPVDEWMYTNPRGYAESQVKLDRPNLAGSAFGYMHPDRELLQAWRAAPVDARRNILYTLVDLFERFRDKQIPHREMFEGRRKALEWFVNSYKDK